MMKFDKYSDVKRVFLICSGLLLILCTAAAADLAQAQGQIQAQRQAQGQGQGQGHKPPEQAPQKASQKAGQKTGRKVQLQLIGFKSTNPDSAELIKALVEVLESFANSQIKKLSELLADDVTMQDQLNSNYVYGKEGVIKSLQKYGLDTANNYYIKTLRVFNPKVQLKGKRAIVSYRSTKEEVFPNSTSKMESDCTLVFIQKDGRWLLLQHLTNWHPTSTLD